MNESSFRDLLAQPAIDLVRANLYIAREMVARQLRNLRTIYLQAVDWRRAVIAIEHLRLVEPEESRHLRDLGLVYYQSGRRIRGCYYLEQYLAANPDAEDAPDLRRGLKERLDQWAVAN